MAHGPYPGLRPFERDEADIFFGREKHVDAMIARLARQRLLVVTGTSGCGKSSLVRAGLLEALETGLLTQAGSVWRFAILRPREHPMAELAAALLDALGGGAAPEAIALRRAALERGPLSLVEELRERPLSEHANLLILVDQFEELFRYQGLAGREEAEAFVALLLASAEQRAVPVYIVVTMRSDFFGECARFEGLAEAVCESIYLCPRLSRDQITAAIEGPARVFGGGIEPALVARIINDMGTDPDQLPLMQHALMRLWDAALLRGRGAPLLRLDDYMAADGLKGSLSRHADEILTEIARDAPARSDIARHLFCLATEGEGERAVRRLAPVAEVAAVSEQPIAEVAAVAEAFRAPGRSLLMPPPDRPLGADTVLDLSHESLIRQWDTLKDWGRREAESVRRYREAEHHLHRWIAGQSGLWQPQELRSLLDWRMRDRPNAAWAARYGGDFALIDTLLDRSRAHWHSARYAVVAASFGFGLLVLTDFLRDRGIKANTVSVAVALTVLFGLIYHGLGRNFASARNWSGAVLLLFVAALALSAGDVASGQAIWTNFDLATWPIAAFAIACLGFAVLRLRRLARTRGRRRRAPLQWLAGRLPRGRRGASELASSAPPVTPSAARDQVAAEARDRELRRRLTEEAERWRTAGRRDAAIVGTVIALPLLTALIFGLIWVALVRDGVRQVEAEMKFVAIPAGCFAMGSPKGEAERFFDEGPVHRVCLKDFVLGKYEVTQWEWRRIMIFPNTPDPSYFKYLKGNDRLPVENVSWHDAQRFLWLMSLFGHRNYRLPSEAEWEYAARAGTTTSRYWGNNIDDACAYENIADRSLKRVVPSDVVADCDDGYPNTAPVGSFKPNPWGLYDMLGNVLAWVEDCFVASYFGAPTDGSPNTKGACTERVARGGNWINVPSVVRAAYRYHFAPNFRGNGTGFRVASTVAR